LYIKPTLKYPIPLKLGSVQIYFAFGHAGNPMSPNVFKDKTTDKKKTNYFAILR